MGKGICVAGNMAVDLTYHVTHWPNQGELVHITQRVERSTGGAVCNTIMDLARLDPTLPLVASGFAGHDEQGDFLCAELGRYANIDLSQVQRNGETSVSIVISNNESKERTFLQYAGGNADYCQQHIDLTALDVDIFHIGYLLMLPALDAADAEYGTKMAHLLHDVQARGIKTSIDVISESGDRFRTIVVPALRYTDYCVINELEAEKTTGVALRAADGSLLQENIPAALRALHALGVSTWAVIHCPEGGFGMGADGVLYQQKSLRLPQGYIAGTVGAGDAFCAGILYAAEQQKNLPEALRLGVCAAAASLSCANASDGVGPVDEVLKLYAQYYRD